jgi:hypothetical protein
MINLTLSPMAPRALEAARLYSDARRGRLLAAIGSLLRRRSSRLPDLRPVAGRVVGQRDLGLQTTPLAAIRGSEAPTRDFDAAFRPRSAHDRERWLRVARAWLDERPLPAVDLIRAGEIYYVRDGRHRISVAHALGQREIEARVTVWDLAP